MLQHDVPQKYEMVGGVNASGNVHRSVDGSLCPHKISLLLCITS